MKNVAFVTASEQNCGIHYYAQNVVNILKESKQHNFFLFECDSEEQLRSCDADILIINYHPWTLNWYTPDVSNRTPHTQFLIQDHASKHENIYQYTPNVKEVISMDVTCTDMVHFHPGVRPIMFYDDITYHPPGIKLKIGTSGIGQPNKHIDYMINLINQQFTDSVEFRIHFSIGAFSGFSDNNINQMIGYCKSLAKSNVEISLVCQQFTDYELIKWLNENDINIYIYDNFDSNAVSASIDKALSAKKPIGVNNSNFFKHIYSSDISLIENKIVDIVKRETKPLEKFYDIWNPHQLINQYETLVNRYE